MKHMQTPICAGTLVLLAGMVLPGQSAQTKQTYVLQSGRKPGQIDRVVTLLEVGGEVIEEIDGKTHRGKMSVACKLDYDEKTLEVPTDSAGRWRSVRHYSNAAAVVKVGADSLKPALRERRRWIGAQIDGKTVTLFSPRGTLTRDELELVDVLGNSLLLDRLLPDRAVTVGETWKHSHEVMTALLALDEISSTDVQSALRNVTATSAQVEMSGRVAGAVHGVSTEIELKGKYRFHLKSKRIDWLGLLAQEKRNSSYAEKGFDAVARLQVQISPRAASTPLSDEALKDLPLKPTAELTQLSYNSAEGNWRLTHGRRWHLRSDHDGSAVFRMIDRGEFVAQCRVGPLPKVAPGSQETLSEFQNDVRKALDKSFGQFVQASQWAGQQDYRVYRVVVEGDVRQQVKGQTVELPMQWNYYLVANRQGRRVAFVFSFERHLAKRLENTDEQIVRSFRFLDPEVAAKDGE